jgi:hypothetical protein
MASGQEALKKFLLYTKADGRERRNPRKARFFAALPQKMRHYNREKVSAVTLTQNTTRLDILIFIYIINTNETKLNRTKLFNNGGQCEDKKNDYGEACADGASGSGFYGRQSVADFRRGAEGRARGRERAGYDSCGGGGKS